MAATSEAERGSGAANGGGLDGGSDAKPGPDDDCRAGGAAGVSAVVTLSVTRAAGQAARSARTADGKPDFSGIWQAANEANWDLQAHEARAGMVTQQGVYPYEYARVPAAPVLALGAAGGVPGSLGVVEGDGQIPYTPEAAVIKQENAENWIDRDPELKCYLPGVPRAMYMPYPFQIFQSTNKIQMAFEFSDAARVIHLDEVDPPPLTRTWDIRSDAGTGTRWSST